MLLLSRNYRMSFYPHFNLYHFSLEPVDCFISSIYQTNGRGIFSLTIFHLSRLFSVTILYYNNTSEDYIASSSYLHSDRIQYSLYKSTSSDYPINKLRNMAIKRIHTTHFYLCDMDFWPSCIYILFFLFYSSRSLI